MLSYICIDKNKKGGILMNEYLCVRKLPLISEQFLEEATDFRSILPRLAMKLDRVIEDDSTILNFPIYTDGFAKNSTFTQYSNRWKDFIDNPDYDIKEYASNFCYISVDDDFNIIEIESFIDLIPIITTPEFLSFKSTKELIISDEVRQTCLNLIELRKYTSDFVEK
jgi:hypothetical protein